MKLARAIAEHYKRFVFINDKNGSQFYASDSRDVYGVMCRSPRGRLWQKLHQAISPTLHASRSITGKRIGLESPKASIVCEFLVHVEAMAVDVMDKVRHAKMRRHRQQMQIARPAADPSQAEPKSFAACK